MPVAGLGEGSDDAASIVEFRRRGHEGTVDDVDLVGVDRDLAAEAQAAAVCGFTFDQRTITEVTSDRVDRRHVRCDCAKQAKRTCEFVG